MAQAERRESYRSETAVGILLACCADDAPSPRTDGVNRHVSEDTLAHAESLSDAAKSGGLTFA
ncbi:MAG: hypothetical protein KIS87_14675, partial [Phycisphaeraceae bacterium]|nr:hypothetical protein [Phycisphaeraceae bacterium]